MLTFMEYILHSFYSASGWHRDNIYPLLTHSSQNLIDFRVPQGVSMNVSALATPTSASSYTLTNLGHIQGSVAYLSTSLPLPPPHSGTIDLHTIVPGYHKLDPINSLQDRIYDTVWLGGNPIYQQDRLLFGRLSLPTNALEAMYVRRFNPTTQLLITCVSGAHIKSGGALTMYWQKDCRQYAHEFLYSTNEALLGLRGMYNFGVDLSKPHTASRLSIGGEFYYGVLNKSPGMSTALRYVTQSAYTGSPLTMTLTCNPIMGEFSSTYSLRTGPSSSFSTRYDFNMYSYLSNLSMGAEVWKTPDSVFKMSSSLQDKTAKALWGGRYKDILVNAGVGFNYGGRVPDVTSIGVELQYAC